MSDTEIGVKLTTIAEWTRAGDRAHIAMPGSPENLRFSYAITGLEEMEQYSVTLVFKPDLSQRFSKVAKPDGSWEFVCRKVDPPEDGERFTRTRTHRQGFETGVAWMTDRVEFINFVMRQGNPGEETVDSELCLESGFKYQVAVRINKEGVEEAVYEKEIRGQIFVAWQESEPEEEINKRKRKSEGGGEVETKRQELEESPEVDQPRSSGDSTPTPGPSGSQDSTPTPEDQSGSSREATPEVRLPTFGQAPLPGVMPTFTNRPPPPYQGPPQPSNRPPAFPPPEAPTGDAQEEEDAPPVPRARIGTNRFSAFDRVPKKKP